ncbi:allantoin permease [Sorangium cellulosum]|uniref:Allantoin permease n=1 Tax=Sorangium cellulosum TaxID=56 RepID=A0A4P2QNS9_SORCE|nr:MULTISPECIES: cytosine permease [Sorangium]AUX31163.1 allantoin permease [Sorangium cellulosum]WCQ90545.1 Cytosine permease [Sorangium sp. Soce836]
MSARDGREAPRGSQRHGRGAAARASIGRDDFPLARVPEAERYPWWSVAVQRFGELSALSQLLLGATLGFHMTFWNAFWALTLGVVLLEITAVLTGVAGQREGLSTYVLAQWAGLERHGSSLFGLCTAVSLVGWFGVQNAIFAEGLAALAGAGLPLWAYCIITGAAVTLIVIYGFRSMAWTSYITVPLFLALSAWAIRNALARHELADLVAMPPKGEPMSVAAGATLVAGGFIVGAVITPDMTRYNRSAADVAKQTLVGVTLGEYTIGLTGVLLAHAVQSANVVHIVTTEVGVAGAAILVTGTLKINDWNLYSASLGLVNTIHQTVGRHVGRGAMTLAAGAAGTALSIAGILEHLIGFLTLLGVTFPPVAGIMIADYYVVRRHRAALERTRSAGSLPPQVEPPSLRPLLAWAGGVAAGYLVPVGIPAINALLGGFLAHVALSPGRGPRWPRALAGLGRATRARDTSPRRS